MYQLKLVLSGTQSMSASDSHKDSATTGKLQRSASYASLSVALTLVAIKIWAWLATNSVSVLSSLVDSFLDVLASSITVVAVFYAQQPADSEHRFGHGKAEGLAALAQSFIITLSAIYVGKEALERLTNPQAIGSPALGVGVMAVSIALTLALVSYQRYVVRRTGSMAIAADSMHYQADLAVNFSVAIAVVLAGWTNWSLIDPLVGFGVAAYIVWNTYSIATRALDVLLDRELPEADRESIRTLAIAHPEVHGFHDLRTRFGGSQYFIQFHLELKPDKTLLEAHRIMDDVEDAIQAVYPNCEIIVHTDPLGVDEMRDGFD
jgi:ferrous-iron efflux pump FieF